MADKAAAASPMDGTHNSKVAVHELSLETYRHPCHKAFIFDWQKRLISQILSKN